MRGTPPSVHNRKAKLQRRKVGSVYSRPEQGHVMQAKRDETRYNLYKKKASR